MIVSVRKILIKLIIYSLFFRQIYSYNGTPYTLTEGAYAWQQLPIGNNVTLILELVALLSMILLIVYEIPFFSCCLTMPYALIFIFLIFATFFWSVITAIDIGIITMFHSSTAPFVYITGLCVCIGADEKSYNYFLKHARIVGLLSLVMSIVAYILFLQEHPTGILSNSSVLVLYIQAFWLLCIYSLGGGQSRKRTVYTEICISGVLAVLFNSRSWIIQSIIWLVVYSYCQGKRKGLVKVLKILALVIIMFLIVYYFVDMLYPDVLSYLVNKPSISDTRSGQYTDLFNQTTGLDFLLGQGYGFQYRSTIQGGSYSYIDNAYLFMLIRYGISIGLIYPLIFIYPVVKHRFGKEIIPIIMWLAALGGLSVYCTIMLDIKSIALAIIAGRCLYQSSYLKGN